ncbi:MAG: shikimate dehydrogenase [Eubacteriales bacterium]|nr:shikimate dehydrogenase [Eubacteriales bacterium]
MKVKLFLLGKGISKSVSPEIHNNLLQKAGIDAKYGLMDVDLDEIPSVITKAKAEDVWGFNVTSPYKAEILKYLDWTDERVKILNASNTVVHRNGKLYGYNTDVDGVLSAVDGLFVPGSVLILGRSGAAKAAILAFKDRPVTVYCRDDSKDSELRKIKEDIQIVYDLKEVEEGMATNLVQATTVGYNEDKSLLEKPLPGQETLFDMIYSPWQTSIMNKLEVHGIVVKNGYDMVLGQAEKCFSLFTEDRV